MSDDDEITNFTIYRVAYSHDPHTRGWCIYEMIGSALSYIDGPWISERDAKEEMRILNKQQGMKL